MIVTRKKRTWGRFPAVGLALIMAVGVWTAATPVGRIIVLNSDTSVAKYREVAAAFQSAVGLPITTVNVADTSERELRRMISRMEGDVIYCIGAQAIANATEMAKDTPIVFSSAINWKRFKLGARAHVIDNDLPAEAQLTLFRHFFPEIKRVGVLYNRTINRQWFNDAEEAGKALGIEVEGYSVSRASRVDNGLRSLQDKVDAFWLIPDPVVMDDAEVIRLYFEMAHAARKPVFTYSTAFEALKPTLILAPDMPTIGRQAAGLVRDLANAKDVYSPAGSEVVLNLGRVRDYGLSFNRDSFDSVNRIIR